MVNVTMNGSLFPVHTFAYTVHMFIIVLLNNIHVDESILGYDLPLMGNQHADQMLFKMVCIV